MDGYILTKDDIDKLSANGFDMTGVMVGEEALAPEADYLNMGPSPSELLSAGPAANIMPPPASEAAPMTLEVTNPAVVQPPAPAQGVDRDTILQALMASQPAAPAAPSDPYANLSKTQRRMLAFSALSDAGAALAGRSQNRMGELMGRFNDIADMDRKRQAAAQQQTTLLAALGGQNGAPVTGMIDSPEAARARIAQLTQLAITNPSLAPALQLEISRLGSEAERLEALDLAQTEATTINAGKINQARDGISAARRALSASLGLEGEELDKALESGQIDPSAFTIARQGWTPDGEAFKTFEAATNELAAMMTFQNMAEVIASGAKLGILSDSDIKLLGSLSGDLDVRGKPVQTAQTILRLYNKLNQTVRALEAEQGGGNASSLLQKYGLEG